MTTNPRVRTVRGKRVYDAEQQWVALDPNAEFLVRSAWSVWRRRPNQHLYELRYNGQSVGYLLCYTDGWRWETTWNPRTGSQRVRVSKATYPTWQAAASRLIRTDVGRLVCRGVKPPPVTAWERAIGVRGAPWEPRPAKAEHE